MLENALQKTALTDLSWYYVSNLNEYLLIMIEIIIINFDKGFIIKFACVLVHPSRKHCYLN